ncbi:MAG TPA: type I methionyl aminopeptidase [Candidatus Kapabacteria bacterium]|jgi:methionyl aminopeptidase|nr:type I methionyl aminopeptidase [Candidatus Kapabacteria bacterium]
MFRAASSLIKTEPEIAKMRESSHLVAECLNYIESLIAPGITPFDLNYAADKFITEHGGYPAFKGYKVGRQTFQYAACVSLNEAVVHGIPTKIPLKEGDIVSFDVGVKKDGWYGDGAWTFPVGAITPEIQKLLDVTRESLLLGVSRARTGGRLFDISEAVQDYCEAHGYGVVKELVGHGIGKHLHEDPQVPNYVPGRSEGFANIELFEGMTLAIEPMINMGTARVKTAKDKWTVLTADAKPSAHFEHTVVVRRDGGEILTK